MQQVFVKDLYEKTLSVEVELDWSIKDLKEWVKSRTGYTVEQQVLIFAGRPTNDQSTLSDYNVTNNLNTFHILIKNIKS